VTIFGESAGTRNAAPSVIDEFRKERCDWWKGCYDTLFE
jgi:hypothetical protein